MGVPIRISQLTLASPVLTGDLIPIARGSGITGVSYSITAKDLVSNLLSAANTSTLNLSFDHTSRTFSGDVAFVPANKGGTGTTTYSAGQLLIGNNAGGLTATTLTAGPRLNITNASGSITLTPSATNLSTTPAVGSVDINSTTGTSATISAASPSLAGVMSAADKTKLDGIATNANLYVHPSYTWTNVDLTTTSVIKNLTVDSTGHITNWSTRNLGDMSLQNKNSVTIDNGQIHGTDDIKSYNSAKTTMYASIGPDSGSVGGVLTLRTPTGGTSTISNGTTIMNGSLGSVAGLQVSSGVNLLVDQSIYSKQVVYAQGGLQYWTGSSWVVATSDGRTKDVIGNYTQGLSDVIKLNPIKFKFKQNLDPYPGDTERVGLIAQDVKEVFPNCVYELPQKLDGEVQNVHQLDVKDLTYAFINAFKELNEKYNQLEAKYNELFLQLNK